MIGASHSTGPWSFDSGQGAVLGVDGRAVVVLSFHGADSMAQENANGRLMAAAPALLRVAQIALDDLTTPHIKAQDPEAWLALLVGELKAAIEAATPPPGTDRAPTTT